MVLIERKVPNGKLVRVEVEVDNGRISSIRITGDFFMHPEDVLVEIEKRMVGLQRDDVKQKTPEIFFSMNAEIIGFSANDISEMVEEAFEKG